LKLVNNDIKFINFIKDIVKSHNHFNNYKYNYILLDNFDSLSNLNQNRLRVIFEKSLNTTKIIIITSKLNKINQPLLSRFINFRIPDFNLIDKYIYFKNLINNNYYVISDDILFNILKKHSDINYNFINILSYLKKGIINADIYDEIFVKYINIINSGKNLTKKITDMKQLIYLSRSLIDINTFYRRFLEYLLGLNMSNDRKIKLVKIFSENNILLNNSFKDLLYLEGLLIEVYQILTTSS
jgi:DNA polymerase III delta prime subunit